MRFFILLPFFIIGAEAICTKWHKVVKWDTCSDFKNAYKISLETLETLNPKMDCQKLHVKDAICVKEDEDIEEEKCEKHHHVLKGDSCWSIWESWGLTRRQLMQLNPLLNCRQLVGRQKICVKGEYTPGE